jgi:hypothetical protein
VAAWWKTYSWFGTSSMAETMDVPDSAKGSAVQKVRFACARTLGHCKFLGSSREFNQELNKQRPAMADCNL